MKKSVLAYYTLLLMITVSAFQYSAWGLPEGRNEIIDLSMIVISFILVLLNGKINKIFTFYRDISLFRLTIITSLTSIIIILSLNIIGYYIMFMPFRDIILSIIFLYIGLSMSFTHKQFNNIIFVYVLSYMLSSISIMYVFASGFVINEMYLPIPKNQLAPAFGIATIISHYCALKKSGIQKYLYLFMAILLFASLLVIRGRAVIISVIIVDFLFVLFYLKNKRTALFYIFIILFSMPLLWGYLYDALFLNYDVTDINSVSSGRSERNMLAFDYLIKNPFFGTLGAGYGYVHNYLLHTFVLYGFFWGIIVLSVYYKYIVEVIVSIKNNKFKEHEVGPLTVAMLIIVSLFEYTYPYAPGSAVYFSYILMGHYLKNKEISRISGKVYG